MKNHINYLKGLLKHKYYTFIYCLKLKVPLHVAILHDFSKFSAKEWSPYVKNFYNSDGTKRSVRDKSGAYDTNQQPEEFKLAWINHQRNKHHWQSWCNIGDFGKVVPVDMPETYVREMVADWCGAGMSYSGKADPSNWFNSNKEKMVVTENTLKEIESILSEFENTPTIEVIIFIGNILSKIPSIIHHIVGIMTTLVLVMIVDDENGKILRYYIDDKSKFVNHVQ